MTQCGIIQPMVQWKEQFWNRVEVRGPDECWPWKSVKGKVNKNGRPIYGSYNNRQAHVVAYEIAWGETIVAPQQGLHHCDNPPCCNPAHIFAGTAKENFADCWAKGRGHRPIGHRLEDRRIENDIMGKRGPETVPYQVNLNRITRERAVTKARDNGVRLADVVRMAIDKFLDDHITKTVGQLGIHNRRKRKQ